MDQNAEKTKCAVEIRFDEDGNVLKAERYIFSRAPERETPSSRTGRNTAQ